MPTSIQLDAAQLQELASLRADAEALPPTQIGAWAPFYEFLAQAVRNVVLPNRIGPVTAADVLQINADKSLGAEEFNSMVWLMGGVSVNSSVGAFSLVIRQYNSRQGRLRGETFGAEALQVASNEVGRRMAEQILGLPEGSVPGNGGMIPSVAEIGAADLNGVRDILYPGNGTPGDDLYLNQAWPGVIMLGAQGQNFLPRLVASGSADSADTLQDFRDLLFAWDSFKYAIESFRLSDMELAKDLAISFGIMDLENYPGAFANFWNPEWWLDLLVSKQEASVGQALTQVRDVGSNAFLDMLRGSIVGKSKIGSTTDANFVENANTFFNAYGATLKGIGARMLPADAGSLASAARADVNVRSALAALSVVSVDVSSATAQNFTLYDPSTGQGSITQSWIDDRAAFTGNLYKKLTGLGGIVNGGRNLRYFDADSNTEVLVGAGAAISQRVQFLFGGAESDNLSGYGFGDHLYGGDGNDTLSGLGGDDYLQGDGGADALSGGDGADELLGGLGGDSLEGGAGNDQLFGGLNDDLLDGGEDNDILEGGAGTDTYRFNGAWGADTIVDADGAGSIEIDGVALAGGEKMGEGVWLNRTQNVTFTLVGTGAEGMLVIQPGGGNTNTIRVKGWVQGNLGLTMAAEEDPPATGQTYIGDQRGLLLGIETAVGSIPPTSSRYGTFDWGSTSWGADGTLIGGVADKDFNDVIYASAEADSISGLGGNDALGGRAGDDQIDGGEGDDLIAGGAGSDTLRGGAGNDFIFTANDLSDGLQRSTPNDQWSGQGGRTVWTRGSTWATYRDSTGINPADASIVVGAYTEDDVAYGEGGNDAIMGGLGADYLDGGDGNDVIWGHGGRDILVGGAGDDQLSGDGTHQPGLYNTVADNQNGNDFLDGGSGNDTLWGGGANDVLYGGTGNDLLIGDYGHSGDLAFEAHGNDYLDGEDGNDTLYGGGKDDTLYGGAGDDALFGDDDATALPTQHHGRDYLDGGDGNDYLEGGAKADTLLGGDGDDELWGDTRQSSQNSTDDGTDYLHGGEGDDHLYGGGKADTLYGGSGDDHLVGDGTGVATVDQGDDFLYGEDGNDNLAGNGGNDYLDGGTGDDKVTGGAGNDILIGSVGMDTLSGVDGDDSYQFASGDGMDTLEDSQGTNTISFAEGSADSVRLVKSGNDILINYGAGGADQVRIVGGQNASVGAATRVAFADGQSIGLADLLKAQQNQRPLQQLEDQFVQNLKDRFSEPLVRTGTVQADGSFVPYYGAQLDGSYIASFSWVNGATRFYTVGSHTVTATTVPEGTQEVISEDQSVYGERWYASGYGTTSSSPLYYSGVVISQTQQQLARQRIDSDAAVIAAVRAAPARHKSTSQVFSKMSWSLLITDSTPNYSNDSGSFQTIDGVVKYVNAHFSETFVSEYWGGKVLGMVIDHVPTGGDFPTYVNATLSKEVITTQYIEVNAGNADNVITGGDLIHAGGGNDSVTLDVNAYVDGGSGNDLIDAGALAAAADGSGSVLYGNAGDDTLIGGAGQDTLLGGTGTDSLSGGGDDDTYVVLAEEDGLDWISDSGGADKVMFGSGIVATDLHTVLLRNPDGKGYDYLQLNKPGGGGVRLRLNALGQPEVEAISFADGTSVAAATLLANHVDDDITGTAGDDTLIGGLGDDILKGGAGNDVYVFNAGDGRDTIAPLGSADGLDVLQLGTGLAPDNVTADRNGNDLVLAINGSSDQITLQGWWDSDSVRSLIVQFDDGTNWTSDRLSALAGWPDTPDDPGTDGVRYTYGTSGDDTLAGSAGPDVIYGGAGNDVLSAGEDLASSSAGGDLLDGGSGDDTYLVQLGDPVAVISQASAAASDVDVVRFGTGITAASLRFSDVNHDYVEITNEAGQTLVQLQDWWTPGVQRIVRLEFDDGTSIQASDIDAFLSGGDGGDDETGGDGDVQGGDSVVVSENGFWRQTDGSRFDDQLIGGAGADFIFGNSGNDTLRAAEDPASSSSYYDFLDGGSGNDTYLVEQGDPTSTISQASAAAGDMDVVRFGAGITAASLHFSDVNHDYVEITNEDGQTLVQLQGWWTPGVQRIARLEFDDGTLIQASDIDAFLSGDNGGDGGDGGTGGDGQVQGGDSVIVSDNGSWRQTDGSRFDDQLIGGAGTDFIFGNAGNDTMRAAEDPASTSRYYDLLDGGSGNDTYLVEQGDPVATISQASAASGDIDVVRFGAGITAASLQFSHVNRSYVEISDQYGKLMAQLQDWWTPSVQRISRLEFDDGTTIQAGDIDSLITKGLYIASSGTPNFSGHGESQATFYGDSSNNVMTGGAGNDVFDGAAGNDMLNGGEGSDTYYMGPGMGQDVVVEADAQANDADMLQFYNVNSDQLWFRQAGNDLEVSVIGTSDSLTVADWYLGASHHVETVKAGDNKTLTDTQVQNLVQAMASFSPPAAGQTTLPAGYATALSPMLATNWQ